ncbi:hypothetical protein G7Z17_g12369 [Cylindrodendrum hubeiense]|uniref:Uncharacterized protein n=1 Tax=Cylindrodendrum hubeiense TaxID=595255 RepID=A0A9P5L357_9HYPO|nr:hypothetical protein G7Z17_g12369 [Cylindrodendrum hubeiense]
MLSLKSVNNDDSNAALVSSLLSVDENGNLTLLQQDSASQLWQRYPFWHASSENVIELKGYMLRMHAVASSDDESPLIPGCWLRVSSSGVVRSIINGRHASLSPTPQWYQANAKGVLNIMLQNDDATCHQFVADSFRAAKPGSRETSLGNALLDPSKKLIKKLDVGNVSDDDLKAAADSISTLVDQAHQYHDGNQQEFASFKAAMLAPGVGGALPYDAQFFSLGGLIDDIEGAWNWVEHKLEEAWKWGCEFFEDVSGRVWKFIIHIGDEVFNFVLKTVSTIVKAITWVFRKLGALLKDIVEFLGYLFNWTDILDTADSISTSFNVALDYGQDLLSKSELNIDSWLEDLRTTIKNQLPGLQNNTYDGTQESPPRLESEPPSQFAGDGSDEDEVKSGVAYNWSTYYFTYGGGTTNAYLHDDEEKAEDSPEQIILTIWDDVQSEVGRIVKLAGTLAKDLLDFFLSGKYKIQGLMGKISADLVDSMIDSLKTLGNILFEALSQGINLARDVANKTIDIPVLGWLWKHVIAGGESLSLLGLCSLILAIPTTVLYKLKMKIAPPKLKSRLTKESFHQYVSGTAESGFTSDITNFRLAAASSHELVYGEFETISLLVDGAFEGTGLESIPIGPIAAVTNVLNSTSLTFETVGGFISWPVEGSDGTTTMEIDSFDLGKFAKYSKWGLTVTNFAANAVVKIVAKGKKAEQPVLKRWKGSVAAVISVPMLCVALTGDINDSREGTQKTEIIVNHFIEAFLKFGKQWGFAAASWNDEIENEVMYIGLAVKEVCTYVGYGLKVLDFIEGHI